MLNYTCKYHHSGNGNIPYFYNKIIIIIYSSILVLRQFPMWQCIPTLVLAFGPMKLTEIGCFSLNHVFCLAIFFFFFFLVHFFFRSVVVFYPFQKLVASHQSKVGLGKTMSTNDERRRKSHYYYSSFHSSGLLTNCNLSILSRDF
jgi:hypothetical protein